MQKITCCRIRCKLLWENRSLAGEILPKSGCCVCIDGDHEQTGELCRRQRVSDGSACGGLTAADFDEEARTAEKKSLKAKPHLQATLSQQAPMCLHQIILHHLEEALDLSLGHYRASRPPPSVTDMQSRQPCLARYSRIQGKALCACSAVGETLDLRGVYNRSPSRTPAWAAPWPGRRLGAGISSRWSGSLPPRQPSPQCPPPSE
jgi:hypothetical protein